IAAKFKEPLEAKESGRPKEQIVADQATDGMDEFVAKQRAAKERKESGILTTQGNTDQFGRLSVKSNNERSNPATSTQALIGDRSHVKTFGSQPDEASQATVVESSGPLARVAQVFGITIDDKALKESGIGQPFMFNMSKDRSEAKDKGDSASEKPHEATRDEIINPERRRLEEMAELKLQDDPEGVAQS